MKKSLLLYPLIMGVFTLLTWLIINKGGELDPKSGSVQIVGINSASLSNIQNTTLILDEKQSELQHYFNKIENPFFLLLFQIFIIFCISRFFGFILSKFGQSFVIGEMIAGIFLGPSIMGLLFPDFYHLLFPKDSRWILQFLSQIGLALFMFSIGMEFDTEKLKNKAKTAVVISHASIIIPFFLGVAFSYFIYEDFAPAGVPFLAFSLFMGIAMSITAFPVLARIIKDRELTGTPLGVMVITCAATDDITAWCMLTCVMTTVKAESITGALFSLFFVLIFVLVMLFIVRPYLKRWQSRFEQEQKHNKSIIVLSFIILMLSAFTSEKLGVHVLFGSFLAGVIMPRKININVLSVGKIKDFLVLLLLPVFFAFIGLRTQIGLLSAGGLWGTCFAIIFIAVLGKFGGGALSAKIMGQSWKDSLSIGVLMNTRGLMELVVLNIGYDLGILSPEIFVIMVLMALFTTFMTGPLLDLINFYSKKS